MDTMWTVPSPFQALDTENAWVPGEGSFTSLSLPWGYTGSFLPWGPCPDPQCRYWGLISSLWKG